MKPLKLRLTAFGPYKDTETIDFTKLKTNRLFVISGNTGAGKTTIFDGVCFALYGSASGEDRENQTMLRSDFADDDVHTAVELLFTLRGRQYRIFRQLGHVKKGNKSKTGERFAFFEVTDGKEVPCVDRQIVSEIDKKVETLIGLTKDQFKQIVMLPQGEFRKLLTSQTENKEAILRRLFKTESYKWIGERLNKKREEMENQFKQQQQLLDTYIQSIDTTLPKREASTLFRTLVDNHFNTNQLLQGLAEEISFYREKMIHDEKAYEEAYSIHEKKARMYYEQKQINERFIELAKKRIKQNELEQQSTSYTEKEKRLRRAEKAQELLPYEKQLEKAQQEEKKKTLAYEQAQKQYHKAKVTFIETKRAFEKEEKKQQERDEIQQRLTRLRELLPTVQAMDAEKKQLEKLEKTVHISATQLEAQNNEQKQMEQFLDAEAQKIKQLEKDVESFVDRREQLVTMREKATALKRYLDERKKKDTLKKELNGKQTIYEQVKVAHTQLEKKWVQHQAATLAVHLRDGDACPVCGSHNHPNKAHVKEKLVTKEELESSKQQLAVQDSAYREALAAIKWNESRLQEMEEELKQYDVPIDKAESTMEQLVEQGTRLKNDVERLETSRKKLAKCKEVYEKAVTDYKTLEKKRRESEQLYQKQKTAYDTSHAVYREKLRSIPESVRSLTVFEKQITELESTQRQLKQLWEDTQQAYQVATEGQTKAASNCTHAHDQWQEAKLKRKELEGQFIKQLADAQFDSETDYIEAKLSTDERDNLKITIERYKQERTMITAQVKELQTALENKQQTDLTALNEELQGLKQAYEQALQTFYFSRDYFNEAKLIKLNIEKAAHTVKNKEEHLMRITDLYDVIRGQNSQKISFERYLQIEYLEQIIHAANERLKRLSNGQFLLMRSDRQETHGRQSGLSLDVYDAYTGQTRDVKTLSGGEKFNASLCLALGMSDVIQSFQGNITIDTMFIDEGFGSLDEESLHKSIDTLIDLQKSGRTIGVISHVKELKAIFPAVLEVTKTKEGSSKTKFVLQ